MDEKDKEIEALRAQLRERDKRIQELESRLFELERRLGLHSKNSSKPPSSDGLKKINRNQSLRPKGQNPSGGQAGHDGVTLEKVAVPDAVVEHKLEHCPHCAFALADVEMLPPMERQVFDIPPPRLWVTSHQSEVKKCPRCERTSHASFPEDVTAPVQYGSRLRALTVYLNHRQFIPEDRLQELLRDCHGVSLATSTIAGFGNAFSAALSPFMEKVAQDVKAAPVVHLDETGFRMGGKTCWLHVAATPRMTWYRISAKRNDVAALVGILGILMHDHWKTYYSNEVFKGNAHGLCNAHHLRELKAVAELDGDRWARHVWRLLRFALHVMHANQGVVPLPLAERIVTLYHTLLERAVAMYEARPPFDAKGRAKRIGHNLALRLLQRDADTLRFMGEKDVPFTNNQAEQDLRMMKVKQKISGGFRTVEGAKAFARIRSFIGTAIKQAWNVLDAIAHPALHEVKLE